MAACFTGSIRRIAYLGRVPRHPASLSREAPAPSSPMLPSPQMPSTERILRGLFGSCVFLAGLAAGRDAHADSGTEAATCNAAFEEADRLLKANKGGEVDLFAAREQLKICVRPVCAEWQVADCSKSLVAVGERIPTLAVTAADEHGHDVVDVKVLVDGVVLSERIDGVRHEVRNGSRKISCVYPSGKTVDLTRTLAEGTHSALRCDLPLEAPTPPGSPIGTSSPSNASTASGSNDSSSPPQTLRYLGFGAVGVGLVGLTVGTIFGFKASSSKSDANCDAQNFCDAKPLADARSAATVSTVGFVAGGVFAAGGVLLLALAPKARAKVGGLSPVPMTGGAGLLMTRSF